MSERIDETGTRIRKRCEVFTPDNLVKDALDELERCSPQAFKVVCYRYIDTSCGSGNFLVGVLQRKIKMMDGEPTVALKTIYGVDIQEDNVYACRRRLLEIAGDTPEHREIVNQTIVKGDGNDPNEIEKLKFTYLKPDELKPILDRMRKRGVIPTID